MLLSIYRGVAMCSRYNREEIDVLPSEEERVGRNDEVSCGRPVRVGRGNHKRKG